MVASPSKLIIPTGANNAFRRAGYTFKPDIGQRHNAIRKGKQISVWFQNRTRKNQWQYKSGGKDFVAMRNWLNDQVKSKKPASFILVIVDSNSQQFYSRRVDLDDYKQAYSTQGTKSLLNIIRGI